MAIKTIQEKNLTWAHIEQLDEEGLNYLKTEHNFHHLDLEDIQNESHIPKIDIYKNYLFIILQFPQWQGEQELVVAQEIDIFLTETHLITIGHGRSRDLKDVFYRCIKNRNTRRDWMGQTSGYLLSQVLDELFHLSQPLFNNIGKRISTIESDIYAGSHGRYRIRELGKHRRNVLQLQRIIDPERYVIANLSHIRKPFLNEEATLYFDDVHDYLSKLWSIVEAYKETLKGLHITVESLINQQTNSIITYLTILSVIALPYNLVSGIYGMNLSSLPFADKPVFVWSLFGLLTIFIIIATILFRKKRWL